MEASQPLSIESFSYSWLVNLKPSLESLENSLGVDSCDEASSFIEMDPRMPPSKRFIKNSQDFKFDFPISQSPLALVYADDLFSNGYVMPLFVDPIMKMDNAIEASDGSKLAVQGSSNKKTKKNCPKLSKRLLQKYFDFLRPLYRRIRGGRRRRSSSRAEGGGGDSRVHHVMNSWVYSAATSPRVSVAYSVDDDDDDNNWRKSCDSESSIYDAVLHCKRSIAKSFWGPNAWGPKREMGFWYTPLNMLIPLIEKLYFKPIADMLKHTAG